MRFLLYIVLSVLFITACDQDKENYKHIGYIDPHDAISDDGFSLCNHDSLMPYYFKYYYNGGKKALKKEVLKQYDPKSFTDSGYLTFRFIVNCKGQLGRFIIEEVDINFAKTLFDPDLTQQCFDIVKDLGGWLPICYDEEDIDSYTFLTFKLEDGEIIDILH